MKIYKKFNRAEKMVKLLKKAVFFIKLNDASLGCYSNGRENGFCLKLFEGGNLLAIAFSEYRKSDDIVVYVGGWTDFEMQGNVPSEEVYENKKMFGSEEEAVEYIVKQIKGFKNESSNKASKNLQSITK
jgi:hypothetical protein